MRSVIDRRVVAGFLAVSMMLIANAGIGYRNTWQLNQDAALVAHTHEVISQISDLLRTLIDAETGQRGFLITGSDTFAEPYHDALGRVQYQIANLKRLTADNPRQQERLLAFEDPAGDILARLGQEIERRRGGLAEVQQSEIVASKRQMDALRRLSGEMARDEFDLLERRKAETDRAYLVSVTTALLANAWALITIIVWVWLLRCFRRVQARMDDATRQRLVQENVEVAIRQANAALEELVMRRTAELRRSTEELRRSNLDLEQFAYVASHDLQEPLRAVSGCVQVLQKRYRAELDARAHELIAHAVDGAGRMQTLIKDLLDYSRVGTQVDAFEPTDSNTVLSQVLTNLRVAVRESGAEVTHDDLPEARVDAVQLRQLLQNLVNNAIKFRGSEPPRIHVCAMRRDGEWQISVKDNGIGIEREYFERIFVVFQRLHTRSEFPGTGVGLAVCKKIVERCGGRIWVESEPGRGSTFSFTIPDSGANA